MLLKRPAVVAVLVAWVLVAGLPRTSVALPVEPVHRDVGAPTVGSEPPVGPSSSTLEGSRAQMPTGKVPRTPGEQRQGSVVAVFEDPADPLIVIAVDNGFVTVRLRCGSLCPSIHLGDYVVVEGQRRSEAVLDAVDVWVATP